MAKTRTVSSTNVSWYRSTYLRCLVVVVVTLGWDWRLVTPALLWRGAARMRRRGLITPRAAMECTDWTSFALLSSAVFIIFADQNLMVTFLSSPVIPVPT